MNNKNQQGFTLIEIVLVIILIGIIASLGSRILSGSFQSYQTSKELSQNEWQGQLALERLSQDLRGIRSATPADLTMLPSNQITFTDGSANVITYSLSGTTLMRNAQPLADGISNLNFAYTMNDGRTVAASADQVSYISIALTLLRAGGSEDIRTSVHPRNFP